MKKIKGAANAGTCDRHKKVLFVSRAAARQVRKRYKGSKHLDTFRCDERPDLYHLGGMPSVVSRGVTSREDVVHLPRTA